MTISKLNIYVVKSSHMHTNTFHASNPSILPYNVKSWLVNNSPSYGEI